MLNSMENKIKYFYVDLKSRLGVNLNVEEEIEKLEEIDVDLIFSYIKSTTEMMIKLKTEECLIKHEEEIMKRLEKLDNDTQEDYETYIRKLEHDIRGHIKSEYEMKLHNDYLESKLEEFEELEEQNKNLKKTLDHFDKKKQLDNYSQITDKKDSEIYILRAENTNLKSKIKEMEDRLVSMNDSEKKLKILSEKNEKENKLYLGKIDKLNKTLLKFEEIIKEGEDVTFLINLAKKTRKKAKQFNHGGIN
jgi:hypothetical protein